MSRRDPDEAFVRDHAPMVEKIARKTQQQFELQAELDELVAAGYEGLFDAWRRYDPTLRTDFRAFAYHRVRGAMIDHVRRTSRLPRRTYAALRAAESALSLGEEALDRRASGAALSDLSDELRRTVARLTSSFILTAVGQSDDGIDRATAEDQLLDGELIARLREAVAGLPDREKRLVEGHYFDGRRFDRVAAELGVSKSWASRLHAKALDRLRAALEAA